MIKVCKYYDRLCGVIVTKLSRSVQVIKILRCQIKSAKNCIRTKRSEITQVPEPISSLIAPSELVYTFFFLIITLFFFSA